MKTIRILGLGNILRGDDGIGPEIISQLQQKSLSLPIEAVDIGIDAFSMLDYLRSNDPVIIIDCAIMKKMPGEVVRFRISQSNIGFVSELISLHGIGFGEVYKMAKCLGNVAECTVIGIEPKSIEINSKLSVEVRNSIPFVIEMVVEEINSYVKKDTNH